MKTFFRWVVRLAVTFMFLLLLLAVLAVLLKDVIAKSLAERNLRNGTGLDAKIEKMEVGLATPTVSLEGLRLYNTADFGGGTFLEMPELRVEYLPGDIRDRKLHFESDPFTSGNFEPRLPIPQRAEVHPAGRMDFCRDPDGRRRCDFGARRRNTYPRAWKREDRGACLTRSG